MDEILQWIGTHWVEWVFCLVGIILTFLAKHHVKVQKELMEEKWKDKEQNMCGKIISTLEEKISAVEDKSIKEDLGIYEELNTIKEELQAKDKTIHNELNDLHKEMNSLRDGILSIQGKQFKELCEKLLEQDYITVEEYEDFELEYAIYKGLKGNHRGDSLHARVVAKCDKQENRKKGDSLN